MKLLTAPKIRGLIEAPKSMYIAGVDPISNGDSFSAMVLFKDGVPIDHAVQDTDKYYDWIENGIQIKDYQKQKP